jgi:hypothetical protein
MLPPGFINIALHYVITKLEAIIVMSAGCIFLCFGVEPVDFAIF